MNRSPSRREENVQHSTAYRGPGQIMSYVTDVQYSVLRGPTSLEIGYRGGPCGPRTESTPRCASNNQPYSMS